jgi:glycosyltransferase involved in cell wall biosynthesis
LVWVFVLALGWGFFARGVGGVRVLVVAGARGVLVAPGPATALAAALDRLACAPALAEAIGRAGAARASRVYNEAQMLPRFLSLYRRVLEAPLAAGRSA